MFLRIEELKEKKLIGQSIRMSLVNNQTFALWSGFMPKRNEIKNIVSSDLYSLQVYDSSTYFQNFNPTT